MRCENSVNQIPDGVVARTRKNIFKLQVNRPLAANFTSV